VILVRLRESIIDELLQDSVLTKPFRIAELLTQAAILVKTRDVESWNSTIPTPGPTNAMFLGDGNNGALADQRPKSRSGSPQTVDDRLWNLN